MSLEGLIATALRPVAGSRVYPDLAPADAQRPYITYQVVGGSAVNYVEASVPDIQNARVQISVWADTRLAASDVGKQAEDALRLCLPLRTTVLTARRSLYDPTEQLRGCMQDFDFWY
ncbi:DUF3168 domain-containing protein [Rugamonas aquatica]|uniref:DUF3168 domain-containing protein n=1 Tax=Rugamonas aquatica TaxID=2743357 RepID=A0A6A7N1T1_9BURK|nr:DUF3168 domain-containing protein [Rugamonas aquatica]MQA39034.1 DUF3168 domain-containing protein [Rugamonas aquatica]